MNGGVAGNQTFTVDVQTIRRSRPPSRRAKFLTVGVSHASSGANDPAFTGSLTFQLFDDLTPLTTSRIEQLVNEGFYTSPTTGTPEPARPRTSTASPTTSPAPTTTSSRADRRSGNGTGSLHRARVPVRRRVRPAARLHREPASSRWPTRADDTNDTQFFITTGLAPVPRLQAHDLRPARRRGRHAPGDDPGGEDADRARTGRTQPASPILFTSTTLSTTNPNGVIHLDLTGATRRPDGQRDRHGPGRLRRDRDADVHRHGRRQRRLHRRGRSPSGRSSAPVQNQVVGQNQTAVFQLPGRRHRPPATRSPSASGRASPRPPPTAPFTAIPTARDGHRRRQRRRHRHPDRRASPG